MRKVSVVVALTLLTVAGAARAQDEAPAAPAADSAAPAAAPETVVAPASVAAAPADAKLQLGINLLPMALGKVTASAAGSSSTLDTAFAYGVGLSLNYVVIPGLTIGLAPQAIFNVKEKDSSATGGSNSAAKEYDILLRLGYAYTVVPKLSVYGEVLPGYSIISSSDLPSGVSKPKGFVVAFGVGGAFDITDQVFANLGIGYQIGMQKTSYSGADIDLKTKFLRIAIGGGVKF